MHSFNPDFELENDNNAFGWASKPADEFISFRTFPTPSQHTENGKRSGRVLSVKAQDIVVISEPVTLCPGKTYILTSWNQQANLLAQCSVKYSVGPKDVYTASPQQIWSKRSEFFTAGTSVEDVSVNVTLTAKCTGSGGAAVGTDEAGYMIVEVDDISLVQDS